MDDEKLIELVREKTVLYDLAHPKYMDPKFKMSIWQSIGAEMNISGIQCKRRWTNIRDHFRRFMQKRKTESGQATENIKKYKYEDHLQFLLPFARDRESSTHVPLQETEQETLYVGAMLHSAENTDPIEEAPSEEPIANEAETSQPQTSSVSAGRSFQGRSDLELSKMTAAPSDALSVLLMKYLLDKNNPEKKTQPHEIDMFLAGIGSTMKKLSPYNQHIAKGQIFNIVHELESQELFSQSPYSSNVSSRHSQNCCNTNSPSTGFGNTFSPSNSNAGQGIPSFDASNDNDKRLTKTTSSDDIS